MVDCAVFSRAGERIGSVRDILSAGDSHLLVVEKEKGAKEVLIPFSRAICRKVDREKKEIVIDPPDGLLDLNEI